MTISELYLDPHGLELLARALAALDKPQAEAEAALQEFLETPKQEDEQ